MNCPHNGRSLRNWFILACQAAGAQSSTVSMAIDVIVQHEGQHEDGAHRCMTTGNEPTIVVGFNMLPAPSKGAPCPRLIQSTTPSLTPQSANLRIVPRWQLPYAPQTMLTTGLPVSSQSTRRSTKARVSHPSPTGTTPSSSSLASPPMRTPGIGTAGFLFSCRVHPDGAGARARCAQG